MSDWFAIDHLDVERLLAEWRWLCPDHMSLIARDAFGDLFLRDESGQVHRLDVATGKLQKIAESEVQFRELAIVKGDEWFAQTEEAKAAAEGLKPNHVQCIGFSVPLVFAEGGGRNTAYIADLYEHVSFLGDLYKQIAELR